MLIQCNDPGLEFSLLPLSPPPPVDGRCTFFFKSHKTRHEHPTSSNLTTKIRMDFFFSPSSNPFLSFSHFWLLFSSKSFPPLLSSILGSQSSSSQKLSTRKPANGVRFSLPLSLPFPPVSLLLLSNVGPKMYSPTTSRGRHQRCLSPPITSGGLLLSFGSVALFGDLPLMVALQRKRDARHHSHLIIHFFFSILGFIYSRTYFFLSIAFRLSPPSSSVLCVVVLANGVLDCPGFPSSPFLNLRSLLRTFSFVTSSPLRP